MELMAVLNAVVQPGVEPDVPDAPDARDPATAAVFTELLAGLLAPALAPTTDTDPAADADPAAPIVDPRGAAVATAASAEAAALATVAGAATEAGAVGATPVTAAVVTAVISAVDPRSSGSPLDPVARRSGAPALDQDPPVAGPGDPSAARAERSGPPPSARGPAVDVGVDASAPAVVVPSRAASDGTRVEVAAGGADPGERSAPVGAPAAGSAEAPTRPAGMREAEPERPAPTPGAAAADPHTIVATVHRDAAPSASAAAGTQVPTTGTLERALAAQLVERVGALRRGDDGDYELTLQLEPADLGRLELRVRLEGGVVHIQVGAHASGTTDIVRRSLPQLRAALADAGLTAGSLDVGTHTGHAGGGRGHDAPARPGTVVAPSPLPRPAATRPTPTRSHAANGVDVLL